VAGSLTERVDFIAVFGSLFPGLYFVADGTLVYFCIGHLPLLYFSMPIHWYVSQPSWAQPVLPPPGTPEAGPVPVSLDCGRPGQPAMVFAAWIPATQIDSRCFSIWTFLSGCLPLISLQVFNCSVDVVAYLPKWCPPISIHAHNSVLSDSNVNRWVLDHFVLSLLRCNVRNLFFR